MRAIHLAIASLLAIVGPMGSPYAQSSLKLERFLQSNVLTVPVPERGDWAVESVLRQDVLERASFWPKPVASLEKSAPPIQFAVTSNVNRRATFTPRTSQERVWQVAWVALIIATSEPQTINVGISTAHPFAVFVDGVERAIETDATDKRRAVYVPLELEPGHYRVLIKSACESSHPFETWDLSYSLSPELHAATSVGISPSDFEDGIK